MLLVLVTYRSEDTVRPLLETIRSWLERHPHAHLSVVDNSSSQHTIEAAVSVIGDEGSRMRTRLSEGNVGFSPAVNSAVTDAETRWGRFDAIILMNPDIVEADRALDSLVGTLADPTVGIASPLLLDDIGQVDRSSLRRFLNRRRMFVEVLGAPSMARLLGSATRDIAATKGVIDVDVTSGAFMAICRELFGAGLDERLPMYLEDQEICIRARRKGLRVVVLGDCGARHLGGVSRKANSSMARTLRMMELASAPSLALAEVKAVSHRQLRAIVGVGGALRWIAAATIGLACIGSRRRRVWASEQLTLSYWFVAWSVGVDSLSSVKWAP